MAHTLGPAALNRDFPLGFISSFLWCITRSLVSLLRAKGPSQTGLPIPWGAVSLCTAIWTSSLQTQRREETRRSPVSRAVRRRLRGGEDLREPASYQLVARPSATAPREEAFLGSPSWAYTDPKAVVEATFSSSIVSVLPLQGASRACTTGGVAQKLRACVGTGFKS